MNSLTSKILIQLKTVAQLLKLVREFPLATRIHFYGLHLHADNPCGMTTQDNHYEIAMHGTRECVTKMSHCRKRGKMASFINEKY